MRDERTRAECAYAAEHAGRDQKSSEECQSFDLRSVAGEMGRTLQEGRKWEVGDGHGGA